jgi:hypothetical protein
MNQNTLEDEHEIDKYSLCQSSYKDLQKKNQ